MSSASIHVAGESNAEPTTASGSNLSSLLTASAARHPDRAAIVFGGSTLTYADLDTAANRVEILLAS